MATVSPADWQISQSAESLQNTHKSEYQIKAIDEAVAFEGDY
ncbi:elongation factor Ts [Gimesia maris DSM 8797]|jgi:hypothetical protein|nr:elongation factor Ts [Gimesia maris DSM 8797]